MKDPAFTPRWLDLWLQTFTQADVLRLPDAGHYLQEDAHELIVPALLRFLGPGGAPAAGGTGH
jgi:haloalkane dehalogenase